MSSVARGGPLDADQPSPDFDVGRVLARIPAEAAVELVRKQVDPQFSAHYLSLLTKRPDFGAIAARIAADRGCIARWQYAKREYAGPIWRLLEKPAWGAREIESLRWQLFPALLPRFETRALQHLLYRSPQRYHGLIRANLLERLATSTVEELGALFAAADMLDDDALRDDLVRALDPTPLAQIPADADARSAWLRGLSRLFRLERAVAETIVCAIEPAAIADLVSDPMFRDLELHRATAGERLAFKARLVRAWAADDPPACEAQLLSTAQTDFDLLHAAGLDTEPLGHDPHRPEPLCAGDEWLDSVAVAVPGLVEAYAVGMLRTGSSHDAKDVAFSLRTLGHSIVRWLNRQKLSTPDVVWDVAQARMVDAARTGDLETASTIAALELPGDAARLRSFREECVAVFAAAMKGAPVIDYRGPLKELLDVLERDAPDLATALTRGAPP